MAEYLAGDFGVENISVISFSELNSAYFIKSPEAQVTVLPVKARSSNFDEVSQGLSKAKAIEEAERCFQCGYCNLCENCYIFCPEVAVTFDKKTSQFVINQELCRGCGICVNECPCGAISWEEKLSD